MKKIIFLTLAIALGSGCAGQKTRQAEENRLIRENEQRLANLENSVTALNSQIAQINNRVYEVRTKSGQKTSMTVVPIASAPSGHGPAAAVSAPAARPAGAVPVGRKIDPAKKPAQAQAKAQPPKAAQAPASGSLGSPQRPAPAQAAPEGQIALPPADLPDTAVPPVPQGNVQLPMEEAPAIPLPVLPTSELSLPSEQPVAAEQPAAAPSRGAVKPAAKTPVQGEQAAYNAALNAARSGRTAEGIRLFRDFLQKYPNGRYAANAEYWIGECLYSQGKYQDALSEFQNVNTSYPAHHKNADALLKAGITMSKMGDKEGAAEKFRTLIANFPNSEAARRARAMGAH